MAEYADKGKERYDEVIENSCVRKMSIPEIDYRDSDTILKGIKRMVDDGPTREDTFNRELDLVNSFIENDTQSVLDRCVDLVNSILKNGADNIGVEMARTLDSCVVLRQHMAKRNLMSAIQNNPQLVRDWVYTVMGTGWSENKFFELYAIEVATREAKKAREESEKMK